jgi:hypothetical protein
MPVIRIGHPRPMNDGDGHVKKSLVANDRLCQARIYPWAAWPDPSQQIHVVGRRENRPLPEAH